MTSILQRRDLFQVIRLTEGKEQNFNIYLMGRNPI